MSIELDFSNLTEDEILKETDKFSKAMSAKRNTRTACAIARALLEETGTHEYNALAICTVASALVMRALRGPSHQFNLALSLHLMGIETSPEDIGKLFLDMVANKSSDAKKPH